MPKEEALQIVHGYVERLARTVTNSLPPCCSYRGFYRLVSRRFRQIHRSVFGQRRALIKKNGVFGYDGGDSNRESYQLHRSSGVHRKTVRERFPEQILKEGTKMIQTTVKVSGMACSMCEAHINDAIRAAFSVEKVSSSHSKGETVILSKEPLGENALRAAINATGYMAGEISTEVYEKKGFFHFGKKKQ